MSKKNESFINFPPKNYYGYVKNPDHIIYFSADSKKKSAIVFKGYMVDCFRLLSYGYSIELIVFIVSFIHAKSKKKIKADFLKCIKKLKKQKLI